MYNYNGTTAGPPKSQPMNPNSPPPLTLLLSLLLFRSNSRIQHSKGSILLGVQEKNKNRKTENRIEEKVVSFTFASLFPTRKQGQSSRVELGG